MSQTKQERAREWGGHLVFEVKQLCQLGVRLEELRRSGKVELHDAVDAAVLEAFVLHARSLIEFVWLTEDAEQRRWRKEKTDHGRKVIAKAPHANDVLAEHYYDAPAQWQPGSMSLLLASTHEKSNSGIAHCSFTRLDPEEARSGEHAQITRDLAWVLFKFSNTARNRHLKPRDATDIERVPTRLPRPADQARQPTTDRGHAARAGAVECCDAYAVGLCAQAGGRRAMTLTEQVIRKFAAGAPYGIAAVLVGECGPPDLDGNRWRFVVTDGTTVAEVDADLSGTQGGRRGQTIEPAMLERAVEVRSGAFPADVRLTELLARSPLLLRADDLR